MTGCLTTANPAVGATLTPDYALLPGVLQAYKVPAIDLASYIAPSAVPEPAGWGMFLAGLGFMRIVLKGNARRGQNSPGIGPLV